MIFSKQKDKIAFTIAELMVVMFILSVIVASALPTLTKRQTMSQIDFIQPGTILIWYGDWYGNPSSRPPGYVVCDGSDPSAPDLREKFVLGVNPLGATDVQLDAKTNSSDTTLPVANIPSHTHDVVVSSVAHTHTYTMSADPLHNHSMTTGDPGDHAHSMTNALVNAAGYGYIRSTTSPFWSVVNVYLNMVWNYYGETGHVHSINCSATGDHNHGGTFDSTSSVFTHSHQYTITSGGGGSGTQFNIRPPYYALYYIMKT